MNWVTLSVLGFVLLFVASLRRRGADKLPAISSEEFVARFGQFYSASAEQVIEGRKRVARVAQLSNDATWRTVPPGGARRMPLTWPLEIPGLLREWLGAKPENNSGSQRR